ncbi:MAG: NAD(+)/NADH kinase [Acidaminococcaceae bacterium]|nr:NAD(+)/NADH kinase [Acidaminococcaceae bacterium]HBX74607.1 diacylglycerol kinase [Acidaminococcaceae bacterium]
MQPCNQVNVKQFKRVFILYNRYSGRQLFASMISRINEVYKLLKQELDAEIELLDVKLFEQMPELAKRAADEKCDWVIIAGGDGTVRAFVEDMLRLDYRPYISVFPAGTVNLIAKEMSLRNEPVRWVHRTLKGYVYPLYTARANGNLFLTVASVGFDSLVVDGVGAVQKRLLNKFAYVLQSTQLVRQELVFSNWRYAFQVRFNDENEWYTGSSVIVGKSRYYAGRYNLFRDAALSSPYLHAAVFPGNKRADILKYASLIALEGLEMDKGIICRKAKKIEIESVNLVEDFPVELDGDVVASTPLTLEMMEEPLLFIP